MSDTPLLGLPLIEASQAQKHVTHNEALLLLDAMVHLAVTSRTLTAPPALPADGDRYLIAASATGAWLGHSGQIAFREAGAWRFAIPKAGWRLWVAAESLFLLFDGAIWFDVQSFDELQNLNLLGVNTTADATNKLAVSSANVLFNHEGADARVKINKNAAGDTASLLFQTGFSGRAEFGLAGDDDFHVKVSPDGSTFFESFIITNTSGLITIKNGFVLDPQSSDPATPADGQLWYNSTTGTFRKRQNGVTSDLDTGGGGGVSDGDKGDIIVSGGGTVWSLDSGVLSTFGRSLIDDADAATARGTLGLGNVNDTSDAAKPVSTAQQAALDLKAPLASPALTGAPTAPTASPGTDTTQISTTAFVKAAVDAALGGGAATFSRIAKWQAAGNSNTVSAFGAAALTATGTATIVNVGLGSLVDRIRRQEYLVTVAAATAVAGWRGGDRMWTIGDGSIADAGGFTFTCEWANATGAATTTTRCFVGLQASTAAPTDVEPSSLANICGMGWDAADTNIQIMHNDAAGTATKIDLGSNFPVPTTDRANGFLLELTAAPGTSQSVAYKATNIATGNVASGTLTTDLPGTSSTLAPRGWMSVGGTSSVIGIALGEMSIQSNW